MLKGRFRSMTALTLALSLWLTAIAASAQTPAKAPQQTAPQTTSTQAQESPQAKPTPRPVVLKNVGKPLSTDEDPAMIVVNKFGRGESEGSGLLACLGDVVVAGIPLLTTVREPYLDAWEAFHGGYAVELPPRLDAILAWCMASCRAAEPV